MCELNRQISELLITQLKSFPFHNLGQLLDKDPINGGTCFDHAIKLRSELNRMGFEARLHEAEVCMTNVKTHRLVRVNFSNNVSFLDTGTGWPTVYKANVGAVDHEFITAGIRFRIIEDQKKLLVQRYNGRQWRNMNRISLAPQNESLIFAKLPNRYLQPLPYSNELRFCWLHNNTFHRIAGFNLSLYVSGKNCQEQSLTTIELLNYIHNFFPELTTDLKMYLESIH
ncbi:MAG: arylamine N-acetyltransferase [Pseudomonadota bacterium]